MIGVIVPGAVSDDNVGPPSPDLAEHFLARFERGDQFAIVMRQYFAGGDAEAAPGLFRLATTNFRERGSGVQVMASVTAGHGEEFHFMFQCRKLRRSAAEPVLAIVGMRPDA